MGGVEISEDLFNTEKGLKEILKRDQIHGFSNWKYDRVIEVKFFEIQKKFHLNLIKLK